MTESKTVRIVTMNLKSSAGVLMMDQDTLDVEDPEQNVSLLRGFVMESETVLMEMMNNRHSK